jgi:hypothetical protein
LRDSLDGSPEDATKAAKELNHRVDTHRIISHALFHVSPRRRCAPAISAEAMAKQATNSQER